MRWENEGNGRFTLYQGDLAVLTAYARASDLAGRTVDTRDARQTSEELTLSRDERCDDIFFQVRRRAYASGNTAPMTGRMPDVHYIHRTGRQQIQRSGSAYHVCEE